VDPPATLVADHRYRVALTEDIRDASRNRLTAMSCYVTTGR
jgi:hypothetical protein